MQKSIYLCLAVLVGLSFVSESIAQPAKGKQAGQRGQRGAQQAPTPVAVSGGVATLSPKNSKVSFVGTHVGDDPKPRLGGFKSFSGQLATTEDGKGIKSLTMEFQTGSLFSQIGDKLTSHLKNADFLDVENYPDAKFVSTGVSAGEDGMFNVVGDFTLMGKTNSITIPIKLTSSEQGVVATSELKLDRTSFGMNKKTEQVSKEVSIMLSIGEPTVEFASAVGGGKGKGGKNGKGRGGQRRDPAAMFKAMDSDGDGKLTGEEIPERMRQWSDSIDSDGDKSITLQELETAMSRLRGGGGGKGGKAGGGGPRKSRPEVE